MTTTADSDSNRVLGLFSATCVVVGAIIGIGIFFNPKDVAVLTGSSTLAMITWAIGGFIALMGALTFAELGSRCTRNGGQFEILRDAWSAPVGFAYVFCNATIIQAGAIAIIGWYTALNFGFLCQGVTPGDTAIFQVAVVLIVGLTAANAAGVRWGSGIQNATVVGKLATLLLITLLALSVTAAGEAAEPTATVTGNTAGEPVSVLALIFAGLIPVFFSMGGWQHALWIGGEVKQPERNIPLAIVLGLLVVTSVYLLVNWAYFHLLGYAGVVHSQALAAEAVGVVWPQAGDRLVAGAVFVSGFGVLNAQLLSGPRLISGMAAEGKFFPLFAKTHSRTRTPVAAILMLGGLGLAILLIARDEGRIQSLLSGVVLVDAVFFFITGLAIFRLRQRSRQTGSAPPAFQVPLYPLVPLLFAGGEILVLSGAFMVEANRRGAWIGVIWIVAALVIYALFFRDRRTRRRTRSTN
jgi:APA family basic amino acid/polyamine antiporter